MLGVITTKSSDLQNKILRFNDRVHFTYTNQNGNEITLKYRVGISELKPDSDSTYKKAFEENIFDFLKLSPRATAEIMYGYPLNIHDELRYWPPYKKRDYVALTRLVRFLYEKLESNDLENPIIMNKKDDLKTNTYDSIQSLGGKCLKYGDKVIFNRNNQTLNYIVCSTYLTILDSNKKHDVIFELIGVNKTNYCSIHYGYESGYGIFPESHYADYPALTRLVTDIYAKIHFLEFNDNYMVNRWDSLMNSITSIPNNALYLEGKSGTGKSVYIDDYMKKISEKNPFNFKEIRPATRRVLLTSEINEILKTSNNLNNKTNKKQHGNIINVCGKAATITRGQVKSGNSISGKRVQATITVGYLSNREISG